MSDRTSLFRREALEFQAGGDPGGGRLELDRPWDRWLARLVVALLLAGAVAALVLRVDETASGPAVADLPAGTFVALLPEAPLDAGITGEQVQLHLDGPSRSGVTGTVVTNEPADEVLARRAGLPAPDEPSRLVRGTLLPAVPGPANLRTGRAVVVLRSDRAAVVLLRQVVDLSGWGGSP